jgi:DNA-directed RNA polymerase subunit M/transcription elongation factor TFIIS
VIYYIKVNEVSGGILMFCDTCGYGNEEGFIFCEKCGTKLLESEDDIEINEAIEQLKYEGYEIMGRNGTNNEKTVKEKVERKYSKVQIATDRQSKLDDNQILKERQNEVNKPKQDDAFYDRESYLKEFQNKPKDFKIEYPYKKYNTGKIVLIIIEIIVIVALIIIGCLIYNT